MDYQIPRATLDRLMAPKTEGTRHQDILAISLTLVGDGVPDQQIYQIIREHFPPDKTDKEIWDAIRGAHAKSPQPLQRRNVNLTFTPKPKTDQVTKEQAIHNAEQFLRGFSISEENVIRCSPYCIPDHREGASVLMELYRPDEFLNVVCKYTIPEDKPNKANPCGAGCTKTAQEWREYFGSHGVPESKAGAWLRPNPCAQEGTGKEKSYCDSDITARRFLLIESDCLPLEVQLPLLCRLRLPIAALIYSGGSSYHAWARIDAKDKEDFASQAERIIGVLSRFGIDRANKNPSRMARLPGASRVIGAQNGGLQRLIYMNTSPSCTPIAP